MKDAFKESDFAELLEDTSSPAVTLYMPTHVTGWEKQEDKVRYDNLLTDSELRLTGKGTGGVEARQFLRPARDLLSDAIYWAERDRGLAIFLSTHRFRHFRLPVPFEELLYVNGRFWITPLLDVLRLQKTFYVLALSQQQLRLFRANLDDLSEERSIVVPRNLQETLDYKAVEHGSQVHFGRKDAKHKESAVFHGQGDESKARKGELRNFYRIVDDAIRPLLNTHSYPLVLAGVKSECVLFREVSQYKLLVDTEMHRSYDHVSPTTLHDDAREAIQTVHQQELERLSAQLREEMDGRRASGELRDICLAAHNGQIDTLLARRNTHVWGTYVRGTTTVVSHEKRRVQDDDLVDWLAVETLRHGGTVHLCEASKMPSDAVVAARFRYDPTTSRPHFQSHYKTPAERPVPGEA